MTSTADNFRTGPTAIRVSAFCQRDHDGLHLDRPSHVQAVMYLDGAEEADALAALFPKGVRIKRSSLGGHEDLGGGRVDWDRPWTLHSLNFHAALGANGNNGGVNEAGLKRYRSLVKACEKAGIVVEFETGRYGNAYGSREAFEQAAGLKEG